MGLYVTHDCWDGAYSAFTRWRNQVAETAGCKIVEGAEPFRIPHADLPWDFFDAENYMGEWKRAPEDPLLLLIVHSDCEGHLRWEHTIHLAKRLEQILPKMPADEVTGHIGRRGWRGTTQRFIDGLRAAHAARENVEFS